MTGIAMFQRGDTGLVTGDITLVVVKVSDASPVDTTGWELRELMDGMYAVDVPLAVEDSVFTATITATPTKKCDGLLVADVAVTDPWSTQLPGLYSNGSAGHILGSVYPAFEHLVAMHEAGTILVPTPVILGNTITLHRQASYQGLTFTVGPQWTPYLTGTYDIYLTAKKYYTDPNSRALFDVACTIVDTVTVSADLSRSNTDHPITNGWWMIQARRKMDPPTTVPDDVKPMMEGLLVLKPMVRRD